MVCTWTRRRPRILGGFSRSGRQATACIITPLLATVQYEPRQSASMILFLVDIPSILTFAEGRSPESTPVHKYGDVTTPAIRAVGVLPSVGVGIGTGIAIGPR